MKKIIALFIVVTMFFAFTSCAQTNTEITPEFDDSTDNSANFNGMQIAFLGDSEYHNDSDQMFGYKTDTSSFDVLLQRIREIEKRYNCEISFSSKSGLTTLIPSSGAGGIALGDAYYIDDSLFRPLASAGYMLDVAAYSDIVDVNDSFRWGTKNILELVCCNGKLYGLTPASWIDNISPYYFILISNNDILYKNGFSNPHKYYESGTWDRTIFEEIVSKCADKDSGIYGLDTSNAFIMRMAVYSNDIGVLDKNSSEPRSSWHSDVVADSLQWGYDFIQRNKDYITQDGESYDDFIAGNSAMAMTATWHLCRKIVYSDNIKEYSLIPFPCADGQEPGTCGGFLATGLDTISIPVFCENIFEVATVINDIWAPMDGYETEDKLDAYYTSTIFFDPLDMEILRSVIKNAEYNYGIEKVYDKLDAIITNVLTGKNSPAQAIEANIQGVDDAILEFVVPNKEGLESYFAD